MDVQDRDKCTPFHVAAYLDSEGVTFGVLAAAETSSGLLEAVDTNDARYRLPLQSAVENEWNMWTWQSCSPKMSIAKSEKFNFRTPTELAAEHNYLLMFKTMFASGWRPWID